MHPDWQQILKQNPPQETATIPSEAALMPLSSWRVLSVEGADAASLLQNICTNDVNALAVDQAQLNSLCNPKGRVIAIFWLLRHTAGYQLILPHSVSDLLLKRLTMYKLRSDVTMSENNKHFILATIHNALGHDHQLQPLQGMQTDIGYCLRLPGAISRTLCLTEITQATTLSQNHPWVDEINWQRIDIESGIPFIFSETIEKFTPQQINLDLLEAVSFNKGCYPGQEIVARLHYLGSPNRRLFSASAATALLPEIGSKSLLENKSAVGHIVQTQRIESSVKLLLSIKLSSKDQALFLSDNTELTDLSSLVSE